MKPKVRVVEELLHLRYDLPYWIHQCLVYPLVAPNGSTIIVCGHDHGVLVIWRGGRPFKAIPKVEKTRPRANGTGRGKGASRDVDMDGGQSQESPADLSAFEDEEEEVDPAKPYHPIIQQLNLPLETAVLHLAFPRLLRSSQLNNDLFPRLLQRDIVVALACADATTKLLTIPMLPPSPERMRRPELRKHVTSGDMGHGSWGEHLITIPSVSGQQSLPMAISVAFMPRSMVWVADQERPGGDNTSAMDEDTLENESDDLWDIIVATCGSDLLADFAIHKLPISNDGLRIEGHSTSHNSLWRTGSLVNPVISVDLHVPANPRAQQGPYLMIAERNGAVRVFNCQASSESNNGCWIRSLHPGFETTPEGSVFSRTLLDAKYVIGGQAIAVLTAEGEWGVWNISLQKLGKLDGIENNSLSGAIPTKFNISGWIGGTSASVTAPKSSSSMAEQRSSLAPMTPSTRRVRQEALFSGSNSAPTRSPFGGIFVQPTGKVMDGRDADDIVVIWHGDKVLMIPSLSAHWQNKIRGSGSLFGDAQGRIREVNAVDMGGEMRNGVVLFPENEHAVSMVRGLKQTDVLISGDHGFVVLSPPLREGEERVRERPRPLHTTADHDLLARGSLDVEGMGRIMEGMKKGVTNGLASQVGKHLGAATKRKVGFTS